jgi:hypothetical protein
MSGGAGDIPLALLVASHSPLSSVSASGGPLNHASLPCACMHRKCRMASSYVALWAASPLLQSCVSGAGVPLHPCVHAAMLMHAKLSLHNKICRVHCC